MCLYKKVNTELVEKNVKTKILMAFLKTILRHVSVWKKFKLENKKEKRKPYEKCQFGTLNTLPPDQRKVQRKQPWRQQI